MSARPAAPAGRCTPRRGRGRRPPARQRAWPRDLTLQRRWTRQQRGLPPRAPGVGCHLASGSPPASPGANAGFPGTSFRHSAHASNARAGDPGGRWRHLKWPPRQERGPPPTRRHWQGPAPRRQAQAAAGDGGAAWRWAHEARRQRGWLGRPRLPGEQQRPQPPAAWPPSRRPRAQAPAPAGSDPAQPPLPPGGEQAHGAQAADSRVEGEGSQASRQGPASLSALQRRT